LPTSPEWVLETWGIRERHVAEPEEYTSDLAARAGLDAIASAGYEPNEIDWIIVVTATPDRKMPSSAGIAQAKMGIRNCCAAFDVAASLPGLFTPSQSPPSGPSVRFEKFIQLLTSLFGEHQHPASACLIEDAPAVSHQHLVHHCGGGDHFLGNRAVYAMHQGQNLARKLLPCSPLGVRAQYLQACKDSPDTAPCEL